MKTKVLTALTLSVMISIAVTAQQKDKKFAFEAGGGPSFPTMQFADGIRTGFGFECTFRYMFLPHTGLYGGWGANWLSTETLTPANNRDYEETGYILGLDFRHPISDSKFAYYVRAGALYNHIEIENADGNILKDTKHRPGFQIAGGIDIDLGKNWSLTPGVKFNKLLVDTEIDGSSEHLDHQYISARIGIARRF